MAPRPDSPVRVLVVDDHPVVREGLRSMLSEEDIEVVGEAASGQEAIERASELQADVVLLDMKLPDMDGLVALRRLKEVAAHAAILVVSMHDEPALVRQAVSAGAAGYVLKGVGRRELLSSVRAVADGESVLEPALLEAIMAEIPASLPLGPASPPAKPLTPVELEVLRLMAQGLTNRLISERLHWSVSTAKKYVERILEKLDASDRTQAVAAALRQGLLR